MVSESEAEAWQGPGAALAAVPQRRGQERLGQGRLRERMWAGVRLVGMVLVVSIDISVYIHIYVDMDID